MEDVLVIGGGGFVGRQLTGMLREKGYRVRVLSRSAGLGTARTPGIQYVRGEVADAERVDSAVAGTSVVYDLSLGGFDTAEEMERNYVQGTLNVVRACQRHRVRRLIYASTTAALDLGRKGPLDERDGTDRRASELPGLYHIGKIEAERILFDLHAREGFPAVVLRPAIIMGRGGKLAHSGLGVWRDDTCCLVLGKGRHPLPLVLVDDVARAFLLAMTAPDIEGRAFNLVGDVRLSAREMVAHMRQRSKRNFRVHMQSLNLLHALVLTKWLIKKAVGKPADRPSRHALKFLEVNAQIDCTAAKQMLGWRPVSDLETFLEEAIDSHLRPIPPGDLRLA